MMTTLRNGAMDRALRAVRHARQWIQAASELVEWNRTQREHYAALGSPDPKPLRERSASVPPP